ncbi:PP2C family protein-serine/threonine phosphatase [Gimesia maris]|nr:protein phosphatase 2C domain-containing protein [Gimesia maris]EDL57292.1 hypothetical protein PM8797T_16770 [Gimesia maris DSM 8797]
MLLAHLLVVLFGILAPAQESHPDLPGSQALTPGLESESSLPQEDANGPDRGTLTEQKMNDPFKWEHSDFEINYRDRWQMGAHPEPSVIDPQQNRRPYLDTAPTPKLLTPPQPDSDINPETSQVFEKSGVKTKPDMWSTWYHDLWKAIRSSRDTSGLFEWPRFSYEEMWRLTIIIGFVGLLSLAARLIYWNRYGRSLLKRQLDAESKLSNRHSATDESCSASSIQSMKIYSDPKDVAKELIPSLIAHRDPWSLGYYSTKGHVRDENQDCVIGFNYAGTQLLIIADGCGGVPFGAEASHIAVEAMTKELIWAIISGASTAAERLDAGFQKAASALAEKAKELQFSESEAGLRTTLIAVIGTQSSYNWGFIGDGAVKLIRRSGKVIECMDPHRANPDVSNVLSASLGPTPHGIPMLGNIKRESGDLLLAGTDGVFDRVDNRFHRDFMRMAIYCQGDLMKACQDSLIQLADLVDDSYSYVCDDNLSMAAMMDGNPPAVELSFWNTLMMDVYS